MRSIRKRLMRWLLIGQLLAVLLTAGSTFFYVRSELEELFDGRLRQLASNISLNIAAAQSSDVQLSNIQLGDDDFVIQAWSDDGKKLLHLNSREGAPALSTEGFSTYFDKGTMWRSFVTHIDRIAIQASQKYSDRLEVSSGLALGAVIPVMILVVILGLLVKASINYGFKPLDNLVAALEKRHPYSLSPLSDVGFPEEVLPLVNVLNSLLLRLDSALQSQRKFVADAAHELRTPLAAVQLQTQLLQKLEDPEEQRLALMQVRAAVARASHLVRQLLNMARLEPEDWERPFEDIDLNALIKLVVAEHAQIAMQRNIDLGVAQNEDITISGDEESLRIMLGNLIDNALRYTPRGGQVDVTLTRNIDKVQLAVVDNGPGIAPQEREQVFNRFYRGQATKELGSGLGLAIVKEVVTHHNGEISLLAAEGNCGLRVEIYFPV